MPVTIDISPGDVVVTRVPFSNGTGFKARPVLVLFPIGRDHIVAKITSSSERFATDVSLVGWQAAGLLFPSVACLGHLATIEPSLMLRRLGRLSARDWDLVRDRWNARLRL
jgi:hypothetical protein